MASYPKVTPKVLNANGNVSMKEQMRLASRPHAHFKEKGNNKGTHSPHSGDGDPGWKAAGSNALSTTGSSGQRDAKLGNQTHNMANGGPVFAKAHVGNPAAGGGRSGGNPIHAVQKTMAGVGGGYNARSGSPRMSAMEVGNIANGGRKK